MTSSPRWGIERKLGSTGKRCNGAPGEPDSARPATGALSAPFVHPCGSAERGKHLQQKYARVGSTEAAQEGTERVASGKPDRIIVISDLHIGAGIQPNGELDPLEHFYDDGRLATLIDRLGDGAARRGRRAELVLNGDVFDFVRVARLPRSTLEVEQWRALLEQVEVTAPPRALNDARAGRFSRAQRRYGYDCSEHASVWKLLLMARGHPATFGALARWCAAGHGLVIVRGNHDSEWAWPGVRRAMRTLLRRAGSGPLDPGQLRFRLHVYRRANVWIEHGHGMRWITRAHGVFTNKPQRRLIIPVGSLVNHFVLNPLERLLTRSPGLPSSVWLKRLATHDPWSLWRGIATSTVRSLPALLAASWRAWGRRARDWMPARIGGAVGAGVLLLPLISEKVAGSLALDSGYARGGAVVLALAGPQLGLALLEIAAAMRGGTTAQGRRYARGQIETWSRRHDPPTALVVLGHTHAPDLQEWEEDGRKVVYANPGCWMEDPGGEAAPRFFWCALRDGRYDRPRVLEIREQDGRCRTRFRP